MNGVARLSVAPTVITDAPSFLLLVGEGVLVKKYPQLVSYTDI